MRVAQRRVDGSARPAAAGAAMRWSVVLAMVGLPCLPNAAAAQFISLRFASIDMTGGAVFPGAGTDVGVSFGARLGFADLFGEFAQLGVEAAWWSARHSDPAYELRDVMGGIAVWKELLGAGAVIPYLGLGGGIHSLDTSPVGRRNDPLPAEARRIAGGRLGAGGFGGVAVALSRTRTMWVVIEYRYTLISDVPHHEARAGFRLAGRRRVRSVATFP